MSYRRLTSVKIVHRGVPIGEGSLLMGEFSDPEWALDFSVREVRALPAFDFVIAPAMQRFKETRTDEAWDVVCQLWQELELRDDAGALVPIPVVGFDGKTCSLASWEASAAVLARVRERYDGESGTES